MKLQMSYEGLMELDKKGWSVYGTPFNPEKIVVKRESFPEGEIPPHLEPYKGQVKELPVACKGLKGRAFIECLKQRAKITGITKKKEE